MRPVKRLEGRLSGRLIGRARRSASSRQTRGGISGGHLSIVTRRRRKREGQRSQVVGQFPVTRLFGSWPRWIQQSTQRITSASPTIRKRPSCVTSVDPTNRECVATRPSQVQHGGAGS